MAKDRDRDKRRDDDDEDESPKKRSRDDDDDDGEYVSLLSKDAVETGGAGFGPGPATIKKIRFELFEYKPKAGSSKKIVRAPVLLASYDRDGEEGREPYSMGQGPWKILAKGTRVKGPIHGLPNNCNAHFFLASLEEAGAGPDIMSDITNFDGIEVVLGQRPIERDFGADKGGIKKKSLLIVKEITSAPWMDADERPKKSKARQRDDDDEDEKPSKGKKAKNDDDEDEAPRRAKSSKANGAESDDDIDEEAVEALVDLLDGGPVKVKDIEEKVRASLKGNPQRHVIAARAAEDDLLKREKGWTYDSKKGRVELDAE